MNYLTKEFQEFINEQNRLLSEKSKTNREHLMASVIKLSEETGEVADAVLGILKRQRKQKIKDSKEIDLGKELADVMIVCSIIAKTAHIDIDRSLQEKILRIQERNNVGNI